MRGKKAAQSANRRTQEVTVTLEGLQTLLAKERAEHRQEAIDLRGEIKTLRTDASRIAKAEIDRTLKRIEDERRMRGTSDDIAADLMYQKDKFVMNACRYVSMTKGIGPRSALNTVMTWLLDEDFYGPLNPVSLLVKCGLPSDGWVARNLKGWKHHRRTTAKLRLKDGTPAAVSLDRAEREGHEDIHPDYNPQWYSQVFEYAGIVPIDDEGNPVQDADLPSGKTRFEVAAPVEAVPLPLGEEQ